MIRYGFLTKHMSFNDMAGLVYVLQDLSLQRDEQFIKFSSGTEEFIFSKEPDILRACKCKKIFKLAHNFESKLFEQTGVILATPGEPLPSTIKDGMLQKILDNNNLILTGGHSSLQHENLVHEYMFHFYHLYNLLGYRFLNYNQTFNKNNLVGVYYKDTHISGARLKNRTILFESVKSILGDELIAYPLNQTKLSDLLVEYNMGFALWEKIHVPTYTDYMTSVCSIIFETASVTADDVTPREHITEKTLKAILFSKAKIFSLLYCSPNQYQYLISNGFWLLNFEFMDGEVTPEVIRNSVVRACEHVNDLYKEMGSYDEVYRYLLTTYGDRLDKNSQLIDNLLNTCPQDTKQKVLDFIRKNNGSEKKQSVDNRRRWIPRLNPR